MDSRDYVLKWRPRSEDPLSVLSGWRGWLRSLGAWIEHRARAALSPLSFQQKSEHDSCLSAPCMEGTWCRRRQNQPGWGSTAFCCLIAPALGEAEGLGWVSLLCHPRYDYYESPQSSGEKSCWMRREGIDNTQIQQEPQVFYLLSTLTADWRHQPWNP